MKSQIKLVLFVFTAFAIAEGARHVRAQSGALTAPSQTSPTQNPSQTSPTQNPSQTIPGQNPSQTIPPTLPGSTGVTVPGSNPLQTKMSDVQLSTKIQDVITLGPLATNGQRAVGATGITVNDLHVTTTGGVVTLRGSVGSEKERQDAVARAAAVVGAQNVVNELLIR